MSEVIDLCQSLVRLKSLSCNTDEAMLFLKEYLEAVGFNVNLLTFENNGKRKQTSLVAHIGEGTLHLLFAGHIDVVPAGNVSEWKHAPFSATIENGVLYGRGIADMKGGVACFITACKDYLKKNKLSGKITIIISGDEEEPIIEGTKKMLAQLHDKGEKFDFALVGEPSNPKTMGDEIKIGRRGDVVLKITSTGEQGHTAYTAMELNPVHNLINLVNNMLQDKLDNGNDYFPPSSIHVTSLNVYNKATNVVPAKAEVTMDIRFNSEHTVDSIRKWAQKHIQKTKGQFKLEVEPIGESFLSPINKNIEILKSIITKHTGKVPAYSTAGGTSDARFVRQYCPVVEYGLTNSTIHKTNECETLENIETLKAIYKDFLGLFFKK